MDVNWKAQMARSVEHWGTKEFDEMACELLPSVPLLIYDNFIKAIIIADS